jgi:hypothetical protein
VEGDKRKNKKRRSEAKYIKFEKLLSAMQRCELLGQRFALLFFHDVLLVSGTGNGS